MLKNAGISLTKLVFLLVLSGLSPIDQAGAANCCDRAHPAEGAHGRSKNMAVLNPANFFGRAALGYKAAKQAPELCQKLFCYCGCDMTDAHNSLLDCFTSDHGADCQICQEEAIVGLHMQQEGKSLDKIQKAIDEAFCQQYPWDRPSDQLKKYRETIKPDLGKTKAGGAILRAPNTNNPQPDISAPKSKEQ